MRVKRGPGRLKNKAIICVLAAAAIAGLYAVSPYRLQRGRQVVSVTAVEEKDMYYSVQVSGTVEGSRADCLALLDELARRRPGLQLLHVTLGDAAWLKDGQQGADVRMEYELAVYLYDTEAYAG